MRKEFVTKYLIGFDAEYNSDLRSLHRFVITNNAIFLYYESNITDEWILEYREYLDQPKIYITNNFLYISNRAIVVTFELVKKLESYYTYMKRKETLNKLGI